MHSSAQQQKPSNNSYGLPKKAYHKSPKTNVHPKKSNGHHHHHQYLSTDITTLDMFGTAGNQQKKPITTIGGGLKRSQFSNSTAHYVGQQNFGLQNYYPSPNAFYSSSNFEDLLPTELPSLMSVSPYKNDVFDMHQFSEELPTSRLFGAGDMSHHYQKSSNFSDVPKMVMTRNGNNSGLSNGARKNRMVEFRTIDDGNACHKVVVVSDPQTTSNSTNRSTVMPIVNHRMTATIKHHPFSPEPLYSRKVFIGGLPIDVIEEEVWTTFGAFGKVLVDWPRRPEHGRGEFLDCDGSSRRNSRSVSGYVFLVFHNEKSVQQLVNSCEIYENKYYLELSSPTMNDKAVQVRAWRLSDIDYFADDSAPIDHRRTVFIGGVPRPTRACDLARCLESLYGPVSYVGIDIDPELKYPKGAARVTFATAKSFVAAISGRFVQVVHSDTNKRVEIKPYVMEDQICDECEGKLCKFNYAPYFCGDPSCLQYYCEACWDRNHYEVSDTKHSHRPMVRTGDQTRVLLRPPHHPHNSPYSRTNLQSTLNQSVPQNESVISRIVNASNRFKQFSATPTIF
ncbi:unnamed protein product [Caenorhabditis angaria]|uniref:Cytoplasmic polyadenylation element-binding protein 1 n=1 Tax=Caenorhabditis angaria TaxID=860376 RepID=A0A9P1MVS1_9PELO|nr:unnamed protein product [Caenorhabditis angaria]